ncbi:tetratricopeptide repeat protein [Spirulina subsalsa]|uniref:tetratricopeptide repeat protein n=1 Tax=Spirulina subsalsa TaxID=54311 RepID=UPI002238AD24|nr:tetratricopeptide repeat protein [Spirulina subsalsa]
MRTTQKRSPWIYLVLVAVLVLFIGVPLLPLVSSALRGGTRPVANNSASGFQLSVADQTELENRAHSYELVLRDDPNNTTVLRRLLEVRLEQGKLQQALAPLETLSQLQPEQPDYTILLAQARQHLGDYEGSFRAYDRILQANPGDVNALQGMINLQLQQNRPEGAIGRLQDTLKLAAQANAANPGSVDVASVQLLLGWVYAYQERFTEAIAIYDQIMSANPGDFRPVWAKAEILKQQGQYSQAKPLYQAAVALAPPRYKDQIQQIADQLAQMPPPTQDSPEESPE